MVLTPFISVVESRPSHLALIDAKGRSVTYGQFYQDIRDTAAYFHAKGIRKGDRVLVFVPMGLDLYRVVLALFYLGAVAVFLDEWVNRKRLERCCQLAQCSAFVGSRKSRLLSIISPSIRQLPIKLGTAWQKDCVPVSREACVAEDSALITFTTGSTGTPKAADRTHGFLLEQFRALRHEINPQAGDIAMPLLPIVLLMNLGVGATSVIGDYPARKPDKMVPQKLIAQINRYNVNRLTGSPFPLLKLADAMIKEEVSLPSVQQVFTGGAPVFPVDARKLVEAFGQAQIVYGSTEAEPISQVNAAALRDAPLQKGLWVGKPYEGAQVCIVPINDSPYPMMDQASWQQLNLPSGHIGEIVVTGHHVLDRYFANPSAFTQHKIQVGRQIWHRTGDAGFLDEAGQLFLCGRAARMIWHNEQWISPFLWEEQLRQVSGVRYGTVMQATPYPRVVLEVEPGYAHSTLTQTIAKQLPVSVAVVFVKRMPMDPRHHSKIDYGKLSQLLD